MTKLKADPMTFVFDDGNHTVHGYVYDVLRSKTKCCGNDALYLEVVFDKNGYVTSSKTLTGKNECYMKSVVDIVKSIRWDASGVVGQRTIYFEVKPILACSGAGDENVYTPVPILSNPVAVNNDVTENGGFMSDEVTTNSDESSTTTQPDPDPVVETKPDPVVETKPDPVVETKPDPVVESKPDPVIASNPTPDPVVESKPQKEPGESSTTARNPAPTNTQPDMDTEDFLSDDPNIAVNPAPASKPSPGDPRMPGQLEKQYVSTGDKNPDESHRGSHKNFDPGKVTTVQYADDESRVAVLIKSGLRKQGVCGLAQAAIELTVDPRSGNIVQHRVLGANSDDIAGKIPGILSNIRFTRQTPVRHNYRTYIHFKTDIICEGTPKDKRVDLDTVPDMLKTASSE